jgi:PleD family two-component response regulator
MKAPPPDVHGIPRIALLLDDQRILEELEAILRQFYTALMVLTETEKLAEFSIPFVVVVSSIPELQKVVESNPPQGTQILIVAQDNSEIVAQAFGMGATDCLRYPFCANDVIAATEKCLQTFRDGISA